MLRKSPADSARRGKNEALDKKLPDQLAAAGAERSADRDLPLPRGSAREQKIRDIGAGDEQYRTHEPLQNDQRTLEPEPQGGLSAARPESGMKFCRRKRSRISGNFWKYSLLQLFFLALAIQHLHRGLRLFDRDAGLEAAEEIEPRVPLVVELIPGRA